MKPNRNEPAPVPVPVNRIGICRPTRWAWLPAVLMLLAAVSSQAATVTWDDEAGDGHWDNARNWTGDVLPQPGDNVVIAVARDIYVPIDVQVAGLSLAPGGQLLVYGAGVSFAATGSTTADGTSIRATQGAQIRLPGLTQLLGASWLVADGAGSLLDLPALTRFEGAGGNGTQVYVDNGGRVSLGVLQEIVNGTVTFDVRGAGSSFEAPQIVDWRGLVRLNVSAGAHVKLPQLRHYVQGDGSNWYWLQVVGEGSAVEFPALDRLEGSLGSVTHLQVTDGGSVSLNALHELITGAVQIDVRGVGSRFEAPQLTDLRGDQWLGVSGGAKVTLPSLLRYVQGNGDNWYWLRVEGDGSELHLPALQLLEGSLGNATHVQVVAGGRLSLGALTEVITGAVQYEISGVGSRFEAPQLTDLRGRQWFGVSGGAKVTLPSLLRYVQGNGDNGYWLRVEGEGSELHLPALQLLEGSLGNSTHVQVVAGGRLSLDALTEVITGAVQYEISGVGTRFEAPQLTDLRGYQWFGVTGGAQVTLPSLRRFVQGSDNWYWLRVEGDGSLLDLPALDLLEGSLDSATHIQVLSGGQLRLGALKELVTGIVLIDVSGSGTRFELPQLTDIRGQQQFLVSGGAQVTFPALRRFVQGSTSGWYWLTADGVGSLIDCPALEVLEGNLNDATLLRALNAGRVRLQHLPRIVTGHVQAFADGVGSLVDLSSLMQFQDPDHRSRLSASNRGLIAVPAGIQLDGVTLDGVTPGLVFPIAPDITQQPEDLVVAPNAPALFTIAADGTLPIAYQWQRELIPGTWVDLPGETGTSYRIASVTFQEEANYRCSLLNVGGLVNSRAASLRRLRPGEQFPGISQSPASTQAVEGGTAVFQVVATGSAPLVLQWQLNGTNLADSARIQGSQTTRLSLADLALADAGTYRVVVSNPVGKIISNGALLEVLPTNPLVVTVGSPVAEQGFPVVVPLMVTRFTDVRGIRFSLHWDAAQLTLQGVEQFGLPGLTAANFAQPQPGTLTMNWEHGAAGTTSMSDGSTLVAVRLLAKGPVGVNAPMTIDGQPVALEAWNGLLAPILIRGVAGQIAIQTPADLDHDGLPDTWEKRYWGGIAAYNGTDDPDHDGLNNAGEYQAGTDPTKADTDGDGFNDLVEVRQGSDPLDPKSVPPPKLGIFVQQVRVEFTAPTGEVFVIQGSPDLSVWTELERVTGTGGVIQRVYEVNDAHRYFRVSKP